MKDNYNIQVMEWSFLRGKKPNNLTMYMQYIKSVTFNKTIAERKHDISYNSSS